MIQRSPGAEREGGVAKLFLRTITVLEVVVLRLPDTLIMCLRVSDDIDAVIWVKNA